MAKGGLMTRETQNIEFKQSWRGGPRPNYKISESGVMVLCKACPAYLELLSSGAEAPGPTMLKGVEKSVEKTREKIIRILTENPQTTQDDLIRLTGLSAKGIEWNIRTLKRSGRIRRIGPDKGGHWEVVDGQ